MGITDKLHTQKDDLKEEVYEPTNEMILEVEALEAKKAKEKAEKGVVGLMYPMFTLQRINPVKFKLKKKRITFPWQPAPHDRVGILGPLPQLNGVKISKRGGGEQLMWQPFVGWTFVTHFGGPRSSLRLDL